ncbi:bifunctional DNA primase/polymerase [Streptomyces sp. NPDC001920]
MRVRTPSGGLHVWYRATGNRQWLSSVGSSPGRALAWQVDIRAQGSYIIAPGTLADRYTCIPVGVARDPAPLPLWLAQELDRTGHLPAPSIPAPRPVPPRAQQAVLAAGGGRGRAAHILAVVLTPVEACGQVAEGAGVSDASTVQPSPSVASSRPADSPSGKPSRPFGNPQPQPARIRSCVSSRSCAAASPQPSISPSTPPGGAHDVLRQRDPLRLDPEAVAAQIREQAAAVPLPAQATRSVLSAEPPPTACCRTP